MASGSKPGCARWASSYELDPSLVRGLDYYTHTLFEVQSDALGSAQSTIFGGGRYDGLIEQLGGPPTPGIGFGCGIERVLLTCDAEGVFQLEEQAVDCFVVDVTGGGAGLVPHRAAALGVGVACDRAFDGRSMRAQMKTADRSGAQVALIVGEQEVDEGTVVIRDLRGGEQQSVPVADVVKHVQEVLGR